MGLFFIRFCLLSSCAALHLTWLKYYFKSPLCLKFDTHVQTPTRHLSVVFSLKFYSWSCRTLLRMAYISVKGILQYVLAGASSTISGDSDG